jgi:hypothetical protein
VYHVSVKHDHITRNQYLNPLSNAKHNRTRMNKDHLDAGVAITGQSPTAPQNIDGETASVDLPTERAAARIQKLWVNFGYGDGQCQREDTSEVSFSGSVGFPPNL